MKLSQTQTNDIYEHININYRQKHTFKHTYIFSVICQLYIIVSLIIIIESFKFVYRELKHLIKETRRRKKYT